MFDFDDFFEIVIKALGIICMLALTVLTVAFVVWVLVSSFSILGGF